MENKNYFVDSILSFMISTSCIGFAMGILGVIFLPEQRFGYEAYFAPPVFGLLSSLLGLVVSSKKPLSSGQIIFRKGLHLLLIELAIFGINYSNAGFLGFPITLSIALSVLIIYLAVSLLLWLNDVKSARAFNRELKKFQERNRAELHSA